MATQADAGVSVALFVLARLGNATANRNGGNGLGQFLMQLGFGDANAAKLTEIEKNLKEVTDKLAVLQASVNELKQRVESLHCKETQTAVRVAQSEVETAWKAIGKKLDEAKRLLSNKARQKELGKEIVDKIKATLKPDVVVTLIHNTLVGTAGLASMINDCGFSFQEANGEFITPAVHHEVVSLVDYWQMVEAQAAVMDIGVLLDAGKASGAETVHADTEKNLNEELARIKPIPADPNRLVPDTRTRLIWWGRILASRAATAPDLADQIPPRGRWTVPTKSELGELAKKCCGSTDAATWFRDHTPFSFDNPGLWTQVVSSTKSNGRFETLDLAAGSVTYRSVTPDGNVYVLLVNRKSAALWSKYAYSAAR